VRKRTGLRRSNRPILTTRFAYTQVQWTSASWQAPHLSVQYRSDPEWRWFSSCSSATEPQIAHFHPSVWPPHFAHGIDAACAITNLLGPWRHPTRLHGPSLG